MVKPKYINEKSDVAPKMKLNKYVIQMNDVMGVAETVLIKARNSYDTLLTYYEYMKQSMIPEDMDEVYANFTIDIKDFESAILHSHFDEDSAEEVLDAADYLKDEYYN